MKLLLKSLHIQLVELLPAAPTSGPASKRRNESVQAACSVAKSRRRGGRLKGFSSSEQATLTHTNQYSASDFD